jgi:xanthine phosphoribosyltransferase
LYDKTEKKGKYMFYYSYEKFVGDVKQLVKMTAEYDPDTLIAVARGGLALGHAYAYATRNRQLMTINSILYEDDKKGKVCEIFNVPELGKAKKVLILDDIIDSGETMKEVLNYLKSHFPEVEFRVASLYYKKTALMQPDYTLHEANEWIDFYWEKDYFDE